MSVDDDVMNPESFEAEHGGFVPAFFARNLEEAEEYCDLLSDHDIPARCGAEEDDAAEGDSEHRAAGRRGMTHGVAVLVPETLLDEASEIIAEREEFSDFEGDDDEDEDEDEDDEDYGLEGLDGSEDEEEDDEDEEEEEDDDEDEEFLDDDEEDDDEGLFDEEDLDELDEEEDEPDKEDGQEVG